jgi:hypothetical protein
MAFPRTRMALALLLVASGSAVCSASTTEKRLERVRWLIGTGRDRWLIGTGRERTRSVPHSSLMRDVPHSPVRSSFEPRSPRMPHSAYRPHSLGISAAGIQHTCLFRHTGTGFPDRRCRANASRTDRCTSSRMRGRSSTLSTGLRFVLLIEQPLSDVAKQPRRGSLSCGPAV